MLGHERFREQEERSTYAIVDEIVRSVLTAEGRDLDEDMLDTFTRIFFGAMSAAGGSVAGQRRPGAAAALRVEAAIGFIMAGLQQPARRTAPRRCAAARESGYFAKVTLPLTAGTSSTQTWPAGTVSSPPLVDELDRRPSGRPWSRCP